jgi:hypothetical protein
MSRADLINSLAAGRISTKVIDAIRSFQITNKKPIESVHPPHQSEGEDPTESDTDSDSLFGDEDNINSHELAFMNGDSGICSSGILSQRDSKNSSCLIPCRSSDIGGFYAAFCSLGTSVEVATKVRTFSFLSTFPHYNNIRSCVFVIKVQVR